jgi:hypothetical protein
LIFKYTQLRGLSWNFKYQTQVSREEREKNCSNDNLSNNTQYAAHVRKEN